MGCPLNNTAWQQFCCLHEQHEIHDTFHLCEYQSMCAQLAIHKPANEYQTDLGTTIKNDQFDRTSGKTY